jgi:outer membrane protein assembly factor BamB
MNAVAALIVALLNAFAPASDKTAWPQWGGPSRNFVVDDRDLATTWPAGGPRRLWQRPLGEGFSAIVTDGRTLYTLFRDGAADVAIALDAATGATVWQTRYDAPFNETCSERLGPVPRAAPLIAGDRLVTTSAGGLMNSFDRQTGRLIWTVNLLAQNADEVRACGYAASPLAF